MGFQVPGQIIPERHMGHLYSLASDGQLKCHVDGIDISNGMAWSSDNTVFYYIDSIPCKVYAFDFDISAGTVS